MAFYEAAGFIADGTVATTFGVATHMHRDVGRAAGVRGSSR
jgi:hypothetical protein